MAGGVGSRFWPMSRKDHPKQFIDILGTGETLIQSTLRRLKPVCPVENIYVVTNEDYISLVAEQLPGLPKENILSEPSRKNTAPCIAYASYKIRKINPDAVCLVAPSDHLITNEAEYTSVLEKAFAFASHNNALLTLGIKPSRPDTGYGYIQFDTTADYESRQIKRVKTFTEKPDLELAEQFVQSGEFVWNSGMFIWTAASFLDAFEKYMPEDDSLFREEEETFNTPRETDAIRRIYTMVRNISVDYGIMEKAENVYVYVADFGWSDLGTWGSLHTQIRKGKARNSVVGKNVMMYESKDCIIHVPKEKLVVIQGLKGYIVAESDGILLICPKSQEQSIKNLVHEVMIEKGERFL